MRLIRVWQIFCWLPAFFLSCGSQSTQVAHHWSLIFIREAIYTLGAGLPESDYFLQLSGFVKFLVVWNPCWWMFSTSSAPSKIIGGFFERFWGLWRSGVCLKRTILRTAFGSSSNCVCMTGPSRYATHCGKPGCFTWSTWQHNPVTGGNHGQNLPACGGPVTSNHPYVCTGFYVGGYCLSSGQILAWSPPHTQLHLPFI